MQAKTDQELLKQIEDAEARQEAVQAVFSLRPPDPGARFVTPEETDELVEALLKRLADETGESPRDYNVFRNLGSFVVDASPGYVRKMMDQAEIASALANRRP